MAEKNNDSKNSQPRNRRLGRGLASLMANTRPTPATPATRESRTTDTPTRDTPTRDTPIRESSDVPPASNAVISDTDVAAGVAKIESSTAGSYETVSKDDISEMAHSPAPVKPGPARPELSSETPANGAALKVDIADIKPNPHQPRRSFDDDELGELSQSISVQGILQPLLVSADDKGSYTLIAGERRLRAATLAGLKTVPCVIRDATREQMAQWALIENIQRTDLNPIEKAQAYRQYIDSFFATQQQLAEKLGQPRSTIANHLRLLDLCEFSQEAVASGSLSFGHAKVLAALAGRQREQTKLTRKVIDNSLSVRQLEQLVARLVNSGMLDESDEAAPEKPAKSEYVQDVERQLTRVVGARVSIKPSKKSGRGKIVLSYNSLDEFDRITEALGVRLES